MKHYLYNTIINKTINLNLVRNLPSVACFLEHSNDVYVHKGELYLRLRHGVFKGGQLIAICRELTGDLDSFRFYTYEYELVLTIQLDDLLPVYFMNN